MTVPRHDGGFTLLELLVALALLAILMSLVSPALWFARRGQTIVTELERRSEIEAGIAFSAQRLSETTPVFLRRDDGRLQILFDGKSDQIAFTAPARFDATDGGLAQLSLAIGTDLNGQRGLILGWTPWSPALRKVYAAAIPERSYGAQTQLLIPGATGLQLRYFGSASNQSPAEWTSVWTRIDALPKLVELTVTIASRTRRRTILLQLNRPSISIN